MSSVLYFSGGHLFSEEGGEKMDDIHPVCKTCRYDCKKPYAEWSVNVPKWEFCRDYTEGGVDE